MSDQIIHLVTIYFQGPEPRFEPTQPSQDFEPTQPSQDFEFDVGSTYDTIYTQGYSYPQFHTQDAPPPEDYAAVYQTETASSLAETAVASIFGPSVVPSSPEEVLFGQIPEETPPQPSRQYTPAFNFLGSEIEEIEEAPEELGRGKRHKIRKDPYTPSTK